MKTLILNTFQKEWRSRSLLILIILTVVFLIISTALLDFVVNNFLAENQVLGAGKTSFSLFLILISIWSTFVAALIGAGIVRDDLDYQVLPQLLSLPMSRAQYLGSRFLGTWLLLFLYFVATYALAATLFQIVSKESVWHVGILLASLTYAIKTLPILLFSCLFSFFLPKIFSFVCTLILMFIVGFMNSAFMEQTYNTYLQSGGLYRYIAVTADLIFPRVGYWANITDVLLSDGISGLAALSFSPLMQLGHFVLVMALWSWIAHAIFKRKEI